jgi:hypothetical protein
MIVTMISDILNLALDRRNQRHAPPQKSPAQGPTSEAAGIPGS